MKTLYAVGKSFSNGWHHLPLWMQAVIFLGGTLTLFRAIISSSYWG